MLPDISRRLLRAVGRCLRTRKGLLRDASLINMIEKGSRHCRNKSVQVVFEIGANHGQHAELMRAYYDVKPENVFVFEPHPDLAAEIARRYPAYNLFRCALSDKPGRSSFNITPVGGRNDGVSTLGERVLVKGDENYRRVDVEVDTLDNVLQRLPHIERIDIMKIDVEGFTYEVLQGARRTLADKVMVLQLESEVVEVFKGQKLYPDISQLLRELGFIETYKEQNVTQNDTVWVHERYWRRPEEFYACTEGTRAKVAAPSSLSS